MAAAWGWLRPAEPKVVLRYEIAMDSSTEMIRTGRWGRIALSPDGSMLAYIGGPRSGVMLRRRDQLDASLIPGTEAAGAPVFSPDGQRIAFIQNARMLTIASLDGNPPVAVTDSLIGLSGIAWLGNDTLIVDGRGSTPLVRVAARARARPEYLAPLDSSLGETDQIFPEVIPGGAVLYNTSRPGAPHAVAVLDPRSGTRRVLVESARRPRYADGHLVYATSEGALMAAPFDVRNQQLEGPPVVLSTGMPTALLAIDIAASGSGTLAFVTSPEAGIERELIWVSRDGKVELADSTWRAPFTDPAISPDGTRLAISDGSTVGTREEGDVWIKPLRSGGRLRLSVHGGRNRFPAWTRDGRLLFYVSHGLKSAIIENPADGSIAATRRLESTIEDFGAVTATPDGEQIIFQRGAGSDARLYSHRRGDSTSARVFAEESRQLAPALSPDGRYLAFVINDGRVSQVYVAPFPNPGNVKWLVSPGAGVEPVWSNSGKELYYRDPVANTLVVVPVNIAGAFSVGAPNVLFPAPGTARFSVSHDDKRFLMVRPVGAGIVSRNRLTMFENWVQGLSSPARP
jgi:Tol biopolymer transport system component